MRGYGQYCPIARGAEIFAERWTPIVVRNILLGCETFTEIQRRRPSTSTLMSRCGRCAIAWPLIASLTGGW